MDDQSVSYRLITRKKFGDYVDMWGLHRIHEESWSQTQLTTLKLLSTGSGVDLYLVDSGINAHHELNDLHTLEPAFTTLFDAHNQKGKDLLGHGTHLASLLIGRALGLAPEAKLYNVKVFHDSLIAPDTDIIAGLNAVLDHHRSKEDGRPSVLNFSAALPLSPAIDRCFQDLTQAGVVCVAAAGNRSQPTKQVSPAHLPEILTVGSIDEDDTFAPSCNFGEEIDLLAPGVGIDGASHRDPSEYHTFSGSSVASAYTAGVCALVLSKSPRLDPFQVKRILIDSAYRGLAKIPANGTPNLILGNPVQEFAPRWNESQESLVAVLHWNEEINTALTANSRKNLPLKFTLVKGDLPPGVSLSEDGVFHGKPINPRASDEVQYFSFVAKISDEAGSSERLFYFAVVDKAKLNELSVIHPVFAEAAKPAPGPAPAPISPGPA